MSKKIIKRALAFIVVLAVAISSLLIQAPTVNAETQNNTLVTIVARNADENSRINSARFNVKNSSGGILAFNKASNGVYVYSDMGNTQTIEVDSKGKAQLANLPEGSYTVSDYGISSEFLSKGNSTFTISSMSDQFEISMDYTLNVGSLALSFVDGDTNAAIAKGRFVLKDSNGKLVNVTNINNKGSYQCSNSKSGAGEFITNKSGKATVTNIPAGKYVLEQVYAPARYNSGMVTKKITINAKDTTQITVSNVGRYGDLTFKVTSSIDSKKLSGFVFKIVDSNGYAVPVHENEDNSYMYNRGGDNTDITLKSASKDLDVLGLPQGSYTLHMVKGISNYKKIGDTRFSIGHKNNTTLSLKASRAVGNITIIKKDKTSQKPLEDFKVNICSKDGKNTYSFVKNDKNEYEYAQENTEGASVDLITDKNGKIIAKGIPTGTIIIKEIAAPDGYMYSRDNIEQTIAAKTETVYESESDKSNCVLEFIDESNKGVKDVGVRIIDLNGKIILESKSNANGYVLMSNIAEGTYTYEVTEVPSTYSMPEAKAEFSINKDGVATGLTPIKIEYNKISVTALGIEAVDKSGIEFTLTNEEGKNYTATTGTDGIAVFVQVPYGNYSLKQTLSIDGYDVSKDIIENILVDGKFKNTSYEFNLTKGNSASNKNTPAIKDKEVEENKSNTLMVIILILLIVLLAAIGGIGYVLISAKKKQNKQTSASTPAPTTPARTPKNSTNSSNVKKDPKNKKSKINSSTEKVSEPIIVEEDNIVKNLQKNNDIVVPDNINDRKPKKNSKPLDPFNNK